MAEAVLEESVEALAVEEEVLLTVELVLSDDVLSLLSETIGGGGGGGGIWDIKLSAVVVLLESDEADELERESRSELKSLEDVVLLEVTAAGPPRLVACWISLNVAAAELVSPDAM
jgi:hypothetical protein